MEITVCETTTDLIGNDFKVDEAPEADVKGFGRQKLFKLSSNAERPARRDMPNYLH
jgi:hypothetical protein